MMEVSSGVHGFRGGTPNPDLGVRGNGESAAMANRCVGTSVWVWVGGRVGVRVLCAHMSEGVRRNEGNEECLLWLE